MAKIIILKNTTGSIIDISEMGVSIPASDQYLVNSTEYLQLSSTDALTELGTLITSGDIVVNNGVSDLSAIDGNNYIRFPLNVIHDNISGEISAISEKVTPVGTDIVIVEDSEDSFNKKKVQLTNMLSAAMTYQGTFTPSGGSYPSSPSKGDVYKASNTGLVSGVLYTIGDFAVYNGTSWDRWLGSSTGGSGSQELMSGNGVPSMFTVAPISDPCQYTDYSTAAALGKVTNWIYTSQARFWYPASCCWSAKHIEDSVKIDDTAVVDYTAIGTIKPLTDIVNIKDTSIIDHTIVGFLKRNYEYPRTSDIFDFDFEKSTNEYLKIPDLISLNWIKEVADYVKANDTSIVDYTEIGLHKLFNDYTANMDSTNLEILKNFNDYTTVTDDFDSLKTSIINPNTDKTKTTDRPSFIMYSPVCNGYEINGYIPCPLRDVYRYLDKTSNIDFITLNFNVIIKDKSKAVDSTKFGFSTIVSDKSKVVDVPSLHLEPETIEDFTSTKEVIKFNLKNSTINGFIVNDLTMN